jgi:hypothetical protein
MDVRELIYRLLANELRGSISGRKGSKKSIIGEYAKEESIKYAKSKAIEMATKTLKNALQKETGRRDLMGNHATQVVKDSVKDAPLKRTQKQILESNKSRSPSTVDPGNVYFFSYLPENAEKLPFYDEFPVVLVLKKEPGGFLGLNFHYLRHNVRANFFDALLEYTDTTEYEQNPDSEFLVTYTMLLAPKFQKYFNPCIRSYRFRNFITGVYEIEPKDWKTMLFLPLEKFSKMSREEVWKWAEIKK